MTQATRPSGRYPRPGGRPGRRPRAAAAALLAALAAAACSAALDWRQLRPAGWGLAVSLPCRPASQTRTVALAGATVPMELLACSADGHSFAAASADLADPARVGPALAALAAAARDNLQGQVESEQPAAVPGMTPSPAARRWRIAGRLPDGRAVREQVLVFAHGTRVFQLTLLGPQADDARARPLLEAAEVLR